MVKSFKIILFFLLSQSIINQGCDTDKYFGYNYEADQLIQSSTIFGTVLMSYTNTPVENAIIQVGNQTTVTDDSGKYSLIYAYESDEERNKPIEIIVVAENYLTHNTSIIIYPVENQLDISLVYAAPIVENRVLVDSICQAIITDYQGINDIKSVEVHLFYQTSPTAIWDEYINSMVLKQNISNTTSYYQFDAATGEYIGTLMHKFIITVEDWHGYTTNIISFTSSSDSLLFPIN